MAVEGSPNKEAALAQAVSGNGSDGTSVAASPNRSGLSLMTFLVALWRRIAAGHPAEPSRLPVAAAGAAAALIGAGGMVMAYISGGELLGHYPLPSVDLLRMSNDLGFALAGVAGSWAAGVAVATLSIQGYTAGVFGASMRAFGVLTAVALLPAMLFVPIGALILWVLIAAVMWIRRPTSAELCADGSRERERRDSNPATCGVTGRLRHLDAQRQTPSDRLVCRHFSFRG